MRIVHITATALVLAIGAVASVSTASAEERACRGTLGRVTVDNLRVPEGYTCTLERTRVKGTIKVETGATLQAGGIVVVGNVQAEGARSVVIAGGSRIGGSVQIVQGGSARIAGSTVDGSIQLESNRRALVVETTTVGADVQAFQNRGGVRISRNAIDGNLQCKENAPAPTGGGNVVQGSKEDQCRRL
jgi:hypothetical protein